MRSLAAALLLAACASEPIQPIQPIAPLDIDPLAFEARQQFIDASLLEIPQVSEPGAVVLVRPPPVTAICNDGWISYSQRQRGTCSGHGGVRERVNWPAE